MNKMLSMLSLAVGMLLVCAPAEAQTTSDPTVTFTLRCDRGVSATLETITVCESLATCPVPSQTCFPMSCGLADKSDKQVCTVALFTPTWFYAGTSGTHSLVITDSSGNANSCIAEGAVPSRFSCTTASGKGVTLAVSRSH